MSDPFQDAVRWFTFEPGIAQEERKRANLDLRIDAWWAAFIEKSSFLNALFRGQENWDLPAWMHSTLQAVHQELMWEFGPGLDTGHRLVITPESQRHLRPLVHRILERAPTIDGWQFFGHRLAEDFEQLASTIEARTGSPWAGKGVVCSPGESNRIDVEFEFPKKVIKRNPDLAQSQAFIACETLLGEEALDHWIGIIDTVSKLRNSVRVGDFRSHFETIKSAIMENQLPQTPIHHLPMDTDWTLYKLEPPPADDYPRQLDMYVGRSMLPEMWLTAHSDMSFSSRRFSNFCEHFCYLKTDGSEGLDESVFADKGDIEDALDEALRSRDLGCVIGGGTGYRYSYVDMAISDLNQAVSIIRPLLRNGRLNPRSWIQFYDSEWQGEWIGIWENSPPPPMIEQADA